MPQRRFIRTFCGFCRNPAHLLRDQGGGAALEYALAAPMFFALLMGIFYVALTYLAQEGLQTAAQGAGRLFLTGLAQSGTVGNNATAGMSAADFKNAICTGIPVTNANTGQQTTAGPFLPPYLSCNNLSLNVVQLGAYAASGVPAQNCYGSACNTAGNPNVVANATSSSITGMSGQIIMVQLFYNWQIMPTLIGLNGLSPSPVNGTLQLAATSIFTAETYSCAQNQATC